MDAARHRADGARALRALTTGQRLRAQATLGRDARRGHRRGPAVQLDVRRRVRHGVRRPHNWFQLVRFGAVGASGYVVNLDVYTRAACTPLGAATTRRPATVAFAGRGDEQLRLEPPLDVRRPRRARRLPGRALLHRQLVAFLFSLADARAAGRRAGMAKVLAQAIAIVAATPLNFLGNKLWSFREPEDAAVRGRRLAARRRRPALLAAPRVAAPTPGLGAVDRPQRADAPGRWTGRRRATVLTARQVIAIAERCPRSASPAPPPAARRARRSSRARPLAGLLLSARRRGRRARRSHRSRSTTAPAGCSRHWTGFQVAWTMARGYAGAFGRKASAAVRVAPALPAVPRPVHRPAPPVPAAAPRPAGAARRSRSRWPSSTTGTSGCRSRWPTRRCSTCSCAC